MTFLLDKTQKVATFSAGWNFGNCLKRQSYLNTMIIYGKLEDNQLNKFRTNNQTDRETDQRTGTGKT